MCVVSNIGDYFGERFPKRYPDWFPQQPINPDPWPQEPLPQTLSPFLPPQPLMPVVPPGVSQEEFDKLKKEVEKLKKLLELAKDMDETTDEPDCEKEEKIATLKKLAELVGVDLSEVFGK